MSSEIVDGLRGEVAAAAQGQQAAVDAFDGAAAAHLGVNRTDLRCLEILLGAGPASPGRLGAELGLSTGSVTAMLDRLERAGYVHRSPDPEDRRKVVVRATGEAARRAHALYGPIAEEGARELAGYTARELEVVADFLRRTRRLYERHLARIREMPPQGRTGV